MTAGTSTPSSSGEATMDRCLLEAAISGDAKSMKHLALHNPGMLLGITPQGNTCLHIACIQGHEEFCKNILSLGRSPALLSAINEDWETPLLIAVSRGHASLASVLLRSCHDAHLSNTILKQDKHGCNVLHHAIRKGHRMLALELIEAEPALSKAVNIRGESPMFIAVMRNFTDLFEKLLQIPDSAHSGPFGFNVLHAIITTGNLVIAKRIIQTRHWLASQENEHRQSPMHQAAYVGKIDIVTLLLEHDPSLGYLISTGGFPLLCIASSQGHVRVACELLKHCPDAPYCDAAGWTCLHLAVWYGHKEFVQFVLGLQQFRQLVNMPNVNGDTALHLAVGMAKHEMVATLKIHHDTDVTVLNNAASPASWDLVDVANRAMSSTSVKGATATTNWSGTSGMDIRLLEAATSGDSTTMKHLALHDPGVLLGITAQGNTCLHIASIHGHKKFCKDVLVQSECLPLLTATNAHGETTLVAAVTSGRQVSLGSFLLRYCCDQKLSEAILKQDNRGCNALHHAIRCGHRKLALELIEAEPTLSHAVNQYGESAMFIAVIKGYEDVSHKLLEIPHSAHGGTRGYNALHAAVKNGNSAIAKKIMETRPGLATERTNGCNTPMDLAAQNDKLDELRVLLEHDPSLGYIDDGTTGTFPILLLAARRGNVDVARVLLQYCPDAPFCTTDGRTCLHEAIENEHLEFVEFVLSSPQLRKLVNMRDYEGDTPLHVAVKTCNPKMVSALLHCNDIDVTVQNNSGTSAKWILYSASDHAKTLNWNEVSMLMLKAHPQYATSFVTLRKKAKDKVTDSQRKDIKSLTQTYTGNTSLVAILLATITFAAAFTLPGGYSTDAGKEGIPTMARKYAFQAFLISDTLAMCSSLAVAFICVIAKWEDLEFLIYYRSFTKKLMWFAYVATTTAFATGLYTVLAPSILWLAITVCILSGLLPILTKLLGEWPILKLRFRLGRTFKSELLDMV